MNYLPSSNRRASAVGLAVVAAMTMTLTQTLDAACRIVVQSVEVDLSSSSPVGFFDVPLPETVSLEDVSVVGLEAYAFTASGSGSAQLSLQMLSGGTPIGDVFGFTWLDSAEMTKMTRDAGTIVDAPIQQLSVDGIRFTIDADIGMTTTVEGIHPGHVVNVWFFVGAFAPDGPHLAVGLGTWDPIHLAGTMTTEWETILLSPIETAALRGLGRASGSSFSGRLSFSVETELVFANGSALTMDDWSSPSQQQAPPFPPQWVSTRAWLEIGEDEATVIDGSPLTELRWRVHSQGSGVAALSLLAPQLFVYYDAGRTGDVNFDATVDVADLLAMLAAWGSCAADDGCCADLNGNGAVDVADLLLILANWDT
jgi:hypothetical protein